MGPNHVAKKYVFQEHCLDKIQKKYREKPRNDVNPKKKNTKTQEKQPKPSNQGPNT